MRAKVKTRRPIAPGHGKPPTVPVSMLSRSWRASSAPSTGVLPVRTTYLGPRRRRRIYSDTGNHQPVEHHADGREPLLTVGGANCGLYPRPTAMHGRCQQLDRRAWSHQSKNFAGGTIVGFAGIRVADVAVRIRRSAGRHAAGAAINAGTTASDAVKVRHGRLSESAFTDHFIADLL